jgi:hypothetical protein
MLTAVVELRRLLSSKGPLSGPAFQMRVMVRPLRRQSLQYRGCHRPLDIDICSSFTRQSHSLEQTESGQRDKPDMPSNLDNQKKYYPRSATSESR